VDLVPDPLLLRKTGSAGNRTRDLWASSQELWQLHHRGAHRRYRACFNVKERFRIVKITHEDIQQGVNIYSINRERADYKGKFSGTDNKRLQSTVLQYKPNGYRDMDMKLEQART
jgi:hypothetical protein